MPLIKSGSKQAISENIREMQNAGHPHDQAVAAALSNARKYNHMADGGAPWFVRQEARNVFHEGMLHSSIPGRTDKLPIAVGSGSYVIPSDIVSALGQGNSLSGNAILRKMFTSGPYGMGTMKGGSRGSQPRLPRPPSINMNSSFKFAKGGDTGATPIVAAGGEFIVSPETVRKIGDGDPKHGFKILDAFVKQVREKHIKTLKKLPGPAKD